MKYIYGDHWRKLQQASDSSDDVLSSGTVPTAVDSNPTSLMKFSAEFKYYDELAPYFVRDPLNKDSFVVPAPNLQLTSDPPPSQAQQQPPQPQSSSSTTTAQNNAATNTNNNTTTATTQKPTTSSASALPSRDLFDNYTELFTEMLIRLPYQMKKLCLGTSATTTTTTTGTSSAATGVVTGDVAQQHQNNLNQIANMFDFSAWTHYLCEYLLVPQCHYLKRLIKKLLQILCGSKVYIIKKLDQILIGKLLHLSKLDISISDSVYFKLIITKYIFLILPCNIDKNYSTEKNIDR